MFALPGCIFVPAETLRNGQPTPNFMVGNEGSGKPIIEGRTSLIDAVDAMVIACSHNGRGYGASIYHSAKEQWVIVSYEEPQVGWGICPNGHFPLIPMLWLGQRSYGSFAAIELDYNAAGIVTHHRRREHEELRYENYVSPKNYESIFGKEGAARIQGHDVQ